jgi:hypothetical protein
MSEIDKILKDHRGRTLTHKEVARMSHWSPNELDGVYFGDDVIAKAQLYKLISDEIDYDIEDWANNNGHYPIEKEIRYQVKTEMLTALTKLFNLNKEQE